jgi:hypothetical protein
MDLADFCIVSGATGMNEAVCFDEDGRLDHLVMQRAELSDKYSRLIAAAAADHDKVRKELRAKPHDAGLMSLERTYSARVTDLHRKRDAAQATQREEEEKHRANLARSQAGAAHAASHAGHQGGHFAAHHLSA